MLSSLHFSVFIVLMLMILPTSWMHYETQLLLPLAVLLAHAVAAREVAGLHPVGSPQAAASRQRALYVVWGIAACLTAFANQEIFRGGEFDAWPLSLIQSYKLYGVLLVWGALLWAIIKEARAGNVRQAGTTVRTAGAALPMLSSKSAEGEGRVPAVRPRLRCR